MVFFTFSEKLNGAFIHFVDINTWTFGVLNRWTPASLALKNGGKESFPFSQEDCNTPPEHTTGHPLADYERNPFIACW